MYVFSFQSLYLKYIQALLKTEFGTWTDWLAWYPLCDESIACESDVMQFRDRHCEVDGVDVDVAMCVGPETQQRSCGVTECFGEFLAM